jgi:hypothetical protein
MTCRLLPVPRWRSPLTNKYFGTYCDADPDVCVHVTLIARIVGAEPPIYWSNMDVTDAGDGDLQMVDARLHVKSRQRKNRRTRSGAAVEMSTPCSSEVWTSSMLLHSSIQGQMGCVPPKALWGLMTLQEPHMCDLDDIKQLLIGYSS